MTSESVPEGGSNPDVFPQELFGLKLFQQQFIVKCFLLLWVKLKLRPVNPPCPSHASDHYQPVWKQIQGK